VPIEAGDLVVQALGGQVQWSTSPDFPQGPPAYTQVRGVMPFSCAYLAADASTKGRTKA
jgi:hypothetical protein